MKPLRFAVFGLAMAFPAGIGASAARASCYENVGCSDRDYFSTRDLYRLSCQNLDYLRNSMYAERGYCFKKYRYQQLFGNGNCRFETSGEVPLNRVERANVDAIVRVERDKGCR